MGAGRHITSLISDVFLGTLVVGGGIAAAIALVLFGVTLANGTESLENLQKQAILGVYGIEPGVIVNVYVEALTGHPSAVADVPDLNSLPFPAYHDERPLKPLHYWAHEVSWFPWLEPFAALGDTAWFFWENYRFFSALFALAAIVVGMLLSGFLLALGGAMGRLVCPRCRMPDIGKITFVVVVGVFLGSITAGMIYNLMVLGHSFAIPLTPLFLGSSGLETAGVMAFHAAGCVGDISRGTA